MANVDVERLVRYRRMMNERHRNIARAGFSKMAQWIKDLNIKTLTASEATRLLEMFVRIEASAAGSYPVEQTQPSGDQETERPQTLADLLPGIDPTLEADLAKLLDQIAGGTQRQ